MEQGIRVFLADGHEGYRAGLARAIGAHPELVLAGEARDGREALEQALVLRPDVVALEVRLDRLGGLDVCRTLTGLDEPVAGQVVLLSGEPNEALAEAARSAGAAAVLDKSAARTAICGRLVEIGRRRG